MTRVEPGRGEKCRLGKKGQPCVEIVADSSRPYARSETRKNNTEPSAGRLTGRFKKRLRASVNYQRDPISNFPVNRAYRSHQIVNVANSGKERRREGESESSRYHKNLLPIAVARGRARIRAQRSGDSRLKESAIRADTAALKTRGIAGHLTAHTGPLV